MTLYSSAIENVHDYDQPSLTLRNVQSSFYLCRRSPTQQDRGNVLHSWHASLSMPAKAHDPHKTLTILQYLHIFIIVGPSHRTPRMYPPAPAAVPPGYSIYYGLPPPGPHYAMAGYGYGYAMPPGAYVNAPPEVMDLRAMQEALPQIAQLTQIPGMPPMQYNTTAASNEMRRVPRASVPPRQQPQPNPRPAQEYAQ